MTPLCLFLMIFLTACAPSPAKRKQPTSNSIEASSGLLLEGNGLHQHKVQSQTMAELDLYSGLHRYLGGAFEITTTLKEQESHRLSVMFHSDTTVRSHTDLALPPDTQVKFDCHQVGNQWSCLATATLAPEEMQKLKEHQSKKRQVAQQRRADRDYIVDIAQENSLKSKIDRLVLYTHNPRPYLDLNIVRLATAYLQQINIGTPELLNVDGPDVVEVTLPISDSKGCLDGFNVQLLLPSGKIVTNRFRDCNQATVTLPRPILASVDTLPLLLEYRGVTLGPTYIYLESYGSTKRLASGNYHNTIEAIGRCVGNDKNAELTARNRARLAWYKKAAKIGIHQTIKLREEIEVLSEDVRITEIKLSGEL